MRAIQFGAKFLQLAASVSRVNFKFLRVHGGLAVKFRSSAFNFSSLDMNPLWEPQNGPKSGWSGAGILDAKLPLSHFIFGPCIQRSTNSEIRKQSVVRLKKT